MDQDLINQLLLFHFGDRDDIINAIRYSTDKGDVNEILDNLKRIHLEKEQQQLVQLDSSEFYEDEQMIGIKNECKLRCKRKLLTSLRGAKRMKYNKFSTQIGTNAKTAISEMPRRSSSKMNKLLPNPEVLSVRPQKSDKYDIDNMDGGVTFRVMMNKNLADIGIGDEMLDAFNEWMDDNNYDSDAIIEDIKVARIRGDDESNIHQYCQLKNQIKCYHHVKNFVIVNGPTFDSKPRSETVGSGEEEKGRDSRDPYSMELMEPYTTLLAPDTEPSVSGSTATAANKDVQQQPHVVNEAELEQERRSSIKRENNEYVFGQRYYYWPSKQSHEWFIRAKYRNLKEEMLQFISLKTYHKTHEKAVQLLHASDILKRMASNNDGAVLGYDIAANIPLSVANLLALILYTDFDDLAYALKQTFCKLDEHETDESQRMRHREFWNWSKLMTETIECWGTPWRFHKINCLYHNTSFMHYSLFTATFNSPTSMTPYLEVAAMYCEEEGVILEMGQYPKIRPKYFDCSIISKYGYEHEMLFIASDKSMDIESIRVLKSNEDHKSFVKAMRLFNKVTNATILSKLERCEITESDYVIVERLINNKHSFPPYINESFRQFCAEKKRIRMDCYCLTDSRFYHKFKTLFLHKYHRNLLKFDKICKLFPNITHIESWDTGELTPLYLTALKNMLIAINRMQATCRLRKITIHCDHIEHEKVNLSLFTRMFKAQHWIIRQTEQWQLSIFKQLTL